MSPNGTLGLGNGPDVVMDSLRMGLLNWDQHLRRQCAWFVLPTLHFCVREAQKGVFEPGSLPE